MIEMRSHPDVWSNVTLDVNTKQLGLFSFASCLWNDDEGLTSNKRKRNYHQGPFRNLLRSSCRPTRVYFCRRTVNVSGMDKTKGLVFPFALDLTSAVRQFAELTVSQEDYVKCVFEEYQQITTEQYNSMLDHLLSASGRNRIKMVFITVGEKQKGTYIRQHHRNRWSSRRVPKSGRC